jgi:uncharacterized protein involved in exopolysaccharide biosynthesis
MSMLKYDHHRPAVVQLESPDLRSHYEHAAASTLLSIRRRWVLVASLVAMSLVLASAAIPILPRKYSATALVYPNLFSDELEKIAPLASVDAASLVNSEARLITSDATLQAVVKRLGLDGSSSSVIPPSWLPRVDWLRAMFFPETRNHSDFDRQVSLLRNKVEVMKDTRSYLISISFTGRSADEAAQIVNTIALEYLRDKTMRRRRDVVMAAEGELARQLAIYGERHPKVLNAADGLHAARASLKAATTPQDGGRDAITTGESVKLAIPNRTPTSPQGFMILTVSAMAGLLAGIGAAVWHERRATSRRQGE